MCNLINFKFKRKLLLCVSVTLGLLFLAGCSQTTVHLNNRYLNDTQTQQVIDILALNNVSVKVNANPFPQQVTRSALIYSLAMKVRAPHLISHILHVMDNAGWSLEEVDEFLNTNHQYTGNNIGLYLLPNGLSIEHSWTMQRLANE